MQYYLLTSLHRAIIEWAESENRAELSLQLDHFQTAIMENTTFEQLSFRIGYPYVYRHHSTCEHLIIFTDVRWGCFHYHGFILYRSFSLYVRKQLAC